MTPLGLQVSMEPSKHDIKKVQISYELQTHGAEWVFSEPQAATLTTKPAASLCTHYCPTLSSFEAIGLCSLLDLGFPPNYDVRPWATNSSGSGQATSHGKR
ncbi:hypothetical protein EVAR_16423_1 [Eumeta japonica]|uniref:Uncharacterized protein n=1 Tax=Eumeta variegata TaxID=151549 RepID=A0A4C1UK56_EUMVA|nr:hypothetical protein EVAR_16423_1 [Eumeta japonica]